jgi:hypothetical protein
MDESQKFAGRIIVVVLFFIAGCALLYYVIRCLKSGKAAWTDRVNSGIASRKSASEDERGQYWFAVLAYAAIAITLLTLSIFGVYRILSQNG